MATNLDMNDDVQPRYGGDNLGSEEEAGAHESPETDDDSAGYIAYLHKHEVLDAYARAKSENPGALIYLEPYVGDVWSLQVYASEAAKQAFRVHFFYQLMARGSLSPRRSDEQANNT